MLYIYALLMHIAIIPILIREHCRHTSRGAEGAAAPREWGKATIFRAEDCTQKFKKCVYLTEKGICSIQQDEVLEIRHL